MTDRYLVHIPRHANDDPQYVTGYIEFVASGYKQFFSSYAGMLRALAGTVAADVNDPSIAVEGSQLNS